MTEQRKAEIVLELQNYIESPPIKPSQLYGNACSSDTVTIDSWRAIWIKNYEINHKKFGSFKDRSLGKLWNINKNKPCIIVGSGPSLGYNGEKLKDNKDIMTLSCLHNYHFFEDRNIKIDYFVTLDAGAVVLEEISEGGTKTEDEYWESTKDKKLIAFVGSDPKLFEKWQGEVFLYNCPIPDKNVMEAQTAVEEFICMVSNGGNVLGACLYIAKAFLGSNTVAFMGADFSFGYNSGKGHKFHSWDSKYDSKLGNVMRGVDIFGNKVLTWPSYWNFKNWFDYVCLTVPGHYINCTEGGMLGAYQEGNLMCIKQMPITDLLNMYKINESISDQSTTPEKAQRALLF